MKIDMYWFHCFKNFPDSELYCRQDAYEFFIECYGSTALFSEVGVATKCLKPLPLLPLPWLAETATTTSQNRDTAAHHSIMATKALPKTFCFIVIT